MATILPERPPGVQMHGYSELMDAFGLHCPPPRRLTAVAPVGQRTMVVSGGTEWMLLPRNSGIRTLATPMEHLGVALKHEGVDLRVLNRLFECGAEQELTAYINANRAGVYTRRAWFLYEWMTGRQLQVQEPYGAQYVPALDPIQYFTHSATRSTRHKVNDNMPGVPGFCPLIRRTERLANHRIAGLAEEARAAVSNADPAVLRRALGFMLLQESKGSFGIEGETPPRSRLERWGRIIAEARDTKLSIPALETLHRSLFDPKQVFTRFGLRTAGGFVGRHDPRDQAPVPDHVCARPEDLQSLLNGILAAYDRLRDGFDPILCAALIGFGFVFIHPFEDGNGRLHRFLFQKALADMGFNPDGVILPVSAAILEDLPGYRSALEDYSAPTLPYIDWVSTDDSNVSVTNDTSYLYRYFDATRQAEYLADRIERTIRFSLPAELQFLHRFDDAKRRIAALVDLPDRLVSLFIQFCIQNNGSVSARKRSEFFPHLPDGLVEALEQATRASGITDNGQARMPAAGIEPATP